MISPTRSKDFGPLAGGRWVGRGRTVEKSAPEVMGDCCQDCILAKDQVMREYLDYKRALLNKPMNKVATEQYVARIRCMAL